MSIKKKLVFISNIAAPYQVAFAPALNEYYETCFWFYDKIGSRPAFWDVPLTPQCRILDKVYFKRREKYITFGLPRLLDDFDPDIVMLGGLAIPANYFAYRWACKHKKKTVIFTERFRNKKGQLRKKGLYMNILRRLYRKADLIMVSDEDIISQFKDDLGFKNKIVASRYPSDIDKYLRHPTRTLHQNATLIFPNRLTPLYNPLGALEIFNELFLEYPGIKLLMNDDGEQKDQCKEYIATHNLQDSVAFLDNIKNWNDLDDIYRQCDIMLLPAKFSNGNFTIIEAMASGMGVVISDKVLGVGNMIENSKNGFKGSEDTETMKAAIKKYLDHPELLEQHMLVNREKVKYLGAAGTAQFYYELMERYL